MSTNYKLTVRRRMPDGKTETATYKLEHVHSNGNDDIQSKLLADMEAQANGDDLATQRKSVRVWVEEVNES